MDLSFDEYVTGFNAERPGISERLPAPSGSRRWRASTRPALEAMSSMCFLSPVADEQRRAG